MGASPLQLTTMLDDLEGVDPATATAMHAMGLRCVADLLMHLPMRYDRMRHGRTIAELEAIARDGTLPREIVELKGEILSVRPGFRRRTPTEAVLDDGTAPIKLTFFNQPWMARTLEAGRQVIVTGEPRLHQGSLQLTNPKVSADRTPSTMPLAGASPAGLALEPVYPASEAVSSRIIADVLRGVLTAATALLEDHLSDAFRADRNLPSLRDSYRRLHKPEHDDDVPPARRRLAYDELLLLQTGVAMRKHHRETTLHAPALPMTDAIVSRIKARMPFTLTTAQQRVLNEIASDLSRDRPMNRLLQGDVGSGKTAVALGAMLLAVAAGAQAALVAPTELLAEQHMATIKDMLERSEVRFELLTGSTRPATRRVLLERLREGDIDVLVGTHAVLSESAAFANLALAVIDEQHRFGVHQRAVLRSKGGGDDMRPHQLVMTATPIPRTLSLSIFGDLDVSIIDEHPPGRRGITTRLVDANAAEPIYEELAKRARRKEQAWIVVPLIEASDMPLTALQTHLEFLRAGPLAELRLESMHGRLDADQRDAIMSRFRAGEIDALVCTTVIEVGVDVPNATMIVIEDAHRFGLAQLHQLRGRVGRGDKPGLCILMGEATTDDAQRRLQAMVETEDGFRIAERDLDIRGPGELFGTRQSGMPPFRVADLRRDRELLQLARRDAFALIDADPHLQNAEHALLRRRLFKAHGQWMGLGDVG
jgi:ATP-dependent DNA helicase RecG